MRMFAFAAYVDREVKGLALNIAVILAMNVVGISCVSLAVQCLRSIATINQQVTPIISFKLLLTCKTWRVEQSCKLLFGRSSPLSHDLWAIDQSTTRLID